MNPIYKYELTANGTTRLAHPVVSDGLALEYALESNQEFYRAKLSGKLTFQKNDYTFISQQAFDEQFDCVISISYDRGVTWSIYWVGQFWKTDCQFNDDDKTVVVTPNVNDPYNAVLAGLEKEFNLIELAPVIQPVKIDKRPLIQIYVPGQSVIGCFLSNMWWEQECEVITNESTLVSTYKFQKNTSNRVIETSGNISPQLPSVFQGPTPDMTPNYVYWFDNGGYRVQVYCSELEDLEFETDWFVIRLSDNQILWSKHVTAQGPEGLVYDIELDPVADSGATGQLTLSFRNVNVYARRISNILTNTYPIPADDIVADNKNYTRVSGVDISDQIIISSELSATPTQWGIYQPGQYYVMPYDAEDGPKRCYPIARNSWSNISFWFAVSETDWQTEPAWRTEFTLKDAFPIYSVISVLLGKIAPGITHDGTTDYSQFLYGGQPLDIPNQRVFLTPKSNIVTSGYDQPAQKAPITLKLVLDMLKDCFRCYWFIDKDENNVYRFRIEHIEYFRRGGTYTGIPVVGADLTQQIVSRNGKPWAFAQNEYQFDKPDMAAWYQFGWMDNETELFNGLPMEIISKYVNQDKIETIEIAHFSSDVDYMLLNPGDVSQDGFALLCPVLASGEYKLPYYTFTIDGVDYILQNAYVAFAYLQSYYRWDMPAKQYTRNGVLETALGIKKLKTQSVSFPALYDLDMVKLIKTQLGEGTIQKISINLSSRNAKATLKYDTE